MEKTKKEGFSIYFCGEEQCPPGHFFGPAVRPHYLLHIILKGKGIYKTKTQTYHLKAGDAFLISPMESTYYQADEQEPWQYAWVGFDGLDVEALLSHTCFHKVPVFFCPETAAPSKPQGGPESDGTSHPHYTPESDGTSLPHYAPESDIPSAPHDTPEPKTTRQPTCSSLKEQVWCRANDLIRLFRTPEHNPITLQAYFFLLLSCMEGPAPDSSEEFSGLYLQKALDYIQNNYSYPIKIADIASYIGIDRTYLYRIFIQEEQVSPKQYLLQLRLRTAAGMLSLPQYTVTEIAYSCGFKDAASFCNQFKKAFSMTPRKFRDIVRLEQRN